MGQMVEFPSNGSTAGGYLAAPESGTGPGVVVIQEWWGLDPALKDIADRLASGGFVALVPDLYHGGITEHYDPDEATQLMNAMPPERAARDMSSAVDHLAGQANVTGRGIGVIGFCMGGMLTWLLAVNRPDRVLAAVPFYGYPSGDMEPDWAPLSASVHAHMAERDQFFDPAGGTKLETKLRAMGKDVRVIVHPGTGHGFMAAHNTLGTYDPDLFERLWPQVVEFLHEKLG